MSTIAITGSEGKVASALLPYLRDEHLVIGLDLPDNDILDTSELQHTLQGVDTVIHLAGVYGLAANGGENWRSPHQDPINKKLFDSVLTAALYANVGRFIHASSVNVEDGLHILRTEPDKLLLAEPRVFATEPSSGYAKSKRSQESILENFSDMFADGATSIRLGGITPTGLPMEHHNNPEILAHEHKVWLAPQDLGNLVSRIMSYDAGPTYNVLYAVSDNDGRFHDTTNAFDWVPKANSADYL